MCRNIRPLFNLDPSATKEEIRAASLQFVRKVSGGKNPSKLNQKAFDKAVERISLEVEELLARMVSKSPPQSRTSEAEKAKLLV